MKKVLLLLLAFASLALAQDASADVAASADAVASLGLDMVKSYAVVGMCIGVGLAALGGAIGIGNLGASTIAGTARNPGLGGKLLGNMFIIFALIEAQVIYMLVFAFIVLTKFIL
jgi:F-type H+-transporting ATPase subunit c